MCIQGWSMESGKRLVSLSTGTGNRSGNPARFSSSLEAALSSPRPDAGRSELLESIKQKISDGYYNSETVIDDLGHGFAKALDQVL